MKVFIFPVECSKYLVIFLGFVHLSYSANILFYMGTASLGNRIATWPLVTELSNRGHTVTFLSMHPGEVVSHPSVKEVSIKRAVKKYGNPVMYKDSLKLRQENLHQVYWDLIQIDMILVCEAILKDKEIIEWVKVSKFDLVILDSFINDCGMGFSNIFGAKLILLGSSSLLMWQADAFGFGAEESWIPDMQRHFPQDMTYFQRLRNTMRRIRWHIFRDVHFFLQHEKLFKLYLKEYELPEMRDIEKNISLVLVNSHFSHEFARSLPPFIIPVSGMHISDKNKPLPKDIANFIGDNEFIYVSFGSTNLSVDPFAKNVLMTTLGKLSSRVIMQLNEDKDSITVLPSNIYSKSFVPQQDILAHPRIRGFICTSGSHSIQEAIYHSVPLIVLPVFGDQDYNAEMIDRMGYGVRLEIINLTAEHLQNALDQLFHNKTLLDNMRKLSKKFKDRPMNPLDLAVWWIEYVLRHDDTNTLKPFAISQTWYQRRLLDVWFPIFLLAFISILVIICYTIFTIFSFISAVQSYLHGEEIVMQNKKSE